MKKVYLFALVISSMITGCVNIPRESIDINRYSIDLPLNVTKADTTFGLSVYVQPFQADAIHRGDRMLFKSDEHSMNYYYYHRWVISPEKFLTDIMSTVLLKWGIFGKGVYQQDTGIVPTHEIHGRLMDLHADNTKGKYASVIEIKLTVVRIHPETFIREPVYQKSYKVTELRKNSSVESHIEAINSAVEQWLALVRYDLEALFLEEAGVFESKKIKGQGDN